MRVILVGSQARQLSSFFEDAHNPQPCPDKRLGKDLRNGHLGRERLRQAAGTLPWAVHVNESQDVDLVLALGKRLLKGLQARAPLLRAALVGGLSNTASGAGAWDDR